MVKTKYTHFLTSFCCQDVDVIEVDVAHHTKDDVALICTLKSVYLAKNAGGRPQAFSNAFTLQSHFEFFLLQNVWVHLFWIL